MPGIGKSPGFACVNGLRTAGNSELREELVG